MEKFTIEEFFDYGHKNVEGLFMLLSNSEDPEVREVLSNIKNDEYLRKQFDEIIEKALPIELASVENMLIDLTATTAYQYLNQSTVVSLFKKGGQLKMKNIESIEDYYPNLQQLKAALKEYKDHMISVIGSTPEMRVRNFSSQDSRKRFENFEAFVEELSKFYKIAEKSKQACFDKYHDFGEFSSLITALNKKMIAHLKTCAGKVGTIEDFGLGHAEQGVDVFNSFVNEWSIFNGHMINAAKKDKEFRDGVQAEINKAKMEQSKVAPTVSPAEQERRDAIKKANDLYDELCQDFMRDLQNQYALSTKDMYDYFVNVKFKKFVERFQMPLSSSTSTGTANEAAAQIRNLMNYISKISENSYTTSVYPFEKQ